MPYFSIIIPVYNVAPYLRECLDSVLAQTFTDWEAICVDDGSTDGSGAILDEYAAKDKRFRVFHKENGGVSSARNLALNNVKGEWVGFLDGDDIYCPKMMSICFSAVKDYPDVEMVRFGQVNFDATKIYEWHLSEKGYTYKYYGDTLCQDEFDGGFFCRVYKADKVAKIKFPNLIVGEDWVWKIQTIDLLSSILDVHSTLYGYRIRNASAMHSRLSIDKMVSMLKWPNYAWRRLQRTNKNVYSGFIRFLELAQTEGFSKLYFTSTKEDRTCLWEHWLDVLEEISKHGVSSTWIRISSKLICRTKMQFFPYLFYYIPHWLKSHGVHR